MGVTGLSSYLKEKDLWRKLDNPRAQDRVGKDLLVLDAPAALRRYLRPQDGLHFIYDYHWLWSHTAQDIAAFRAAGFRVVAFIDAAIPKDKMREWLARRRGDVKQVDKIAAVLEAEGAEAKAMPRSLWAAPNRALQHLGDALREAGCTVYFSMDDSDREAAAYAAHHGARAVLTSDSDFLMYEQGGFALWDYGTLSVRDGKGIRSICEVTPADVAAALRLPPSLLPLLPAFLGNDHLGALPQFIHKYRGLDRVEAAARELQAWAPRLGLDRGEGLEGGEEAGEGVEEGVGLGEGVEEGVGLGAGVEQGAVEEPSGGPWQGQGRPRRKPGKKQAAAAAEAAAAAAAVLAALTLGSAGEAEAEGTRVGTGHEGGTTGWSEAPEADSAEPEAGAEEELADEAPAEDAESGPQAENFGAPLKKEEDEEVGASDRARGPGGAGTVGTGQGRVCMHDVAERVRRVRQQYDISDAALRDPPHFLNEKCWHLREARLFMCGVDLESPSLPPAAHVLSPLLRRVYGALGLRGAVREVVCVRGREAEWSEEGVLVDVDPGNLEPLPPLPSKPGPLAHLIVRLVRELPGAEQAVQPYHLEAFVRQVEQRHHVETLLFRQPRLRAARLRLPDLHAANLMVQAHSLLQIAADNALPSVRDMMHVRAFHALCQRPDMLSPQQPAAPAPYRGPAHAPRATGYGQAQAQGSGARGFGTTAWTSHSQGSGVEGHWRQPQAPAVQSATHAAWSPDGPSWARGSGSQAQAPRRRAPGGARGPPPSVPPSAPAAGGAREELTWQQQQWAGDGAPRPHGGGSSAGHAREPAGRGGGRGRGGGGARGRGGRGPGAQGLSQEEGVAGQ